MANNVRFTASVDDKVSSSLSKIRDNFDRLGKGAASSSLAGNVGAKLLEKGMNLVGDVTDRAVQFIGDATQAALDEEVSIQKLSTSLKANIPAWDGNTAAIEKVLTARMNLGFSDDDQRQSLALLVGATHDVTKALDIERTAMDLVRYESTQGKVISLADASEALTKVEAGSYRILKSLGIELKAGATQTEALAAVQRVAAGQAADYANTNSGKLLNSQVKVGEAMEKFGAVTMPIVVAAVTAAADGVTSIANAFAVLDGKMPAATTASEALRQKLQGQVDVGNTLGAVLSFVGGGAGILSAQGKMAELELKLLNAAERDASTGAGMMADRFGNASDAADNIALHALTMGDDVKTGSQRALDALLTFKDAAIVDANDLLDQVFDPLIERDRLMGLNAQISAAKRIIASGSASKAEKQDARDTLDSVGKDQAAALLKLANAGQTGSAAYKTGIADLKTEIKNSSGPTKTALQTVLDKILAIDKAFRHLPAPFKVPNSLPSTFGKSVGRAGGGPIAKDELYQVGEHGPEWFVSDKAGKILPTGQSPTGSLSLGPRATSKLGGAGGPTIQIIFNSTFPPTPSDGQRLARALVPELTREMRRQNIL